MTELELTEAALAAHDDRHALHHLAGVFALQPNSERGLAILADVSTRLDVLEALPKEGFVGGVVLRAWALQRAGVPEALGLLAQAATAYPDRGYELVLASWLAVMHAEGRALPEAERSHCYRYLVAALTSTIGLHRLLPGELALLRGTIEVAEALSNFPADEAAPLLISAFLRRAGRLDEALRITEAGAARGDPQALRAHGLTVRTAGRGAEAAALFARLEAVDPGPAEIIEQARSWYVAGDRARALDHLRRAPPPWEGETHALEALFGEPSPPDPLRALDDLRRRMTGQGWLAPRTDATANLLAQIVAQGVTKVRVGVSGWESPSCRLALAVTCGLGADVDAADYDAEPLELAFKPLDAQGGPVLWKEEGGTVRQAVEAPALALRELVARVAATDGDGTQLFTAAEREAAALSAEDAMGLAAVMVHPAPQQPPGADALYRFQCAAAAVIASLPGPIEGPRGQVLRGLALGQVDWVASAAVFALAGLAHRDADAAHFARQALLDTVRCLVPHTAEPRAEQLRAALGTLPGVPNEILQAFQQWHAANFGPEDGSPAEAPHEALAPPPPQAPAARSGRVPLWPLAVPFLAVIAWRVLQGCS